ncbi:MAG: hypothetical protein COT91_04680 [Candidatus Doudnabacteria bacterium CG10_big_fil_rev_8_21_14_0_10_41_10]|uniref:Carboxypeptidase regulatory-like domain-containing protein n=1 Tax=Candidatus Doudnabacteria bacterium CG10_big_fil_rev_8_21_14_0_10_41_10 TaxID=1974551 RepID=A0A2H0VEP5_9BACT|nr:MAG: hypothetical protein COT91_04680 [Candidatus Doudnabacteria bacterium CG10_big_fil_rev_8_21_14_0_10_41_10]
MDCLREVELKDIETGYPRGNIADFLITDKIIVDLKAKKYILKEDSYQMRRYLKSADIELKRIVSFSDLYLKTKRMLNSNFSGNSDTFGDSDRDKGFTLIETVVGVALVTLVFGGLFVALQGSLRLLNQSRIITTAQALATEKMELIKNLPYNDVGTISGIPPGLLPQEEYVVRNDVSYLVRTKIIYIDDPFDDLSPTDTLATDYKQARVEINPINSNLGSKNPVTFISNISPKGIETTAGGGTLSILIFNSLGEPVQSAEVVIQKNNAAPFVDITTYTDSFGRVILPGAPECTECYFVSATKSGYSIDRTYTDAEVANPDKPYLTVLEGQLTEQSFGIDLLSNLTISSFGARGAGFPPLPGVNFHLRGSKIIGTDVLGDPVYEYDQNLSTGGGGGVTVSGLTWGSYDLTLENSPTLDLAGTNPQLLALVPAGQMVFLDFSVAPDTTHSLLVKVSDNSTSLADAQVRVFNVGLGYDQTQSSGNLVDPDAGQAFFSGLTQNSYEVEVTIAGFALASITVQVENDVVEEIILSPE